MVEPSRISSVGSGQEHTTVTPGPRCAQVSGFNVPASVCIPARGRTSKILEHRDRSLTAFRVIPAPGPLGSIVDQHRDRVDTAINWVSVTTSDRNIGTAVAAQQAYGKGSAGGTDTDIHGRLERCIAIAHQHPSTGAKTLALPNIRSWIPSLLKSPTAIERHADLPGPESLKNDGGRNVPLPLPSRTEKPPKRPGPIVCRQRDPGHDRY